MFSSTMMAASTTMPTVRLSPSTVNVFRVNPRKYMTMNVPRMDVGMARSTLNVDDQEPRNSQHTMPVSTAARTRVKRISWIDSSTKTVLSKFTFIDRPSGSDGRRAAIFDHGDVLEADGPALAVGDDEVAEGLEVHGLALRTHVHLALGRLDAAGRHFLVLALDGRGHVLHGQALRLQARGVEPDADGPLAVAAELDLAHAFDGLELGLEDVADVVGHERGRPVARQRDPEDGLVLGVLLGDDRGIHLAREAARRLRHLRLHVLEGDVDVPGEVELDVDAGRALA